MSERRQFQVEATSIEETYAEAVSESLAEAGEEHLAHAKAAREDVLYRLDVPRPHLVGRKWIEQSFNSYAIEDRIAEILTSLSEPREDKTLGEYVTFLGDYFRQELSRLLSFAKRGEAVTIEANVVDALREADRHAWAVLMAEAEEGNEHLREMRDYFDKARGKLAEAKAKRYRARSDKSKSALAAEVEKLEETRDHFRDHLNTAYSAQEKTIGRHVARITKDAL